MDALRPSTTHTAQVLSWLIVVAVPLAVAGACWLWIELCTLMFIPGMFLALPAFVLQIGVAAYAAPLRWLAPELCFTHKGVVTGLPCDVTTWLALAALYTLVCVGLVALVLQWLGRRQPSPD